MSPPREPKAWFRGRNYSLGPLLDTFLVCAASGVILNRVLLIALGYPQVGSRKPDGIHISHSIYGGFAMMVAAAVALSFLAPASRWFLAVVGGLGFGWYVDELGKYVSNAGYLFKPALALIYVVFVLMFLSFRALASRRFTSDDAVVNALESLKSASLGNLDDRQRRDAVLRLDHLGPETSFAARIRELLEDAPASPPRSPGRIRRARSALRVRYTAWSHRRSFTVVIMVFFFMLAASTLSSVIGFSLGGPGITRPSEKVATIAASVAGALVLVGIVQLRQSRLAAYRWFDRALLMWILVVQIYMFQQEQFAAVIGLAIDLFVWAMLRSAIAIEEEHEERARLDAFEAAPLGATP